MVQALWWSCSCWFDCTVLTCYCWQRAVILYVRSSLTLYRVVSCPSSIAMICYLLGGALRLNLPAVYELLLICNCWWNFRGVSPPKYFLRSGCGAGPHWTTEQKSVVSSAAFSWNVSLMLILTVLERGPHIMHIIASTVVGLKRVWLWVVALWNMKLQNVLRKTGPGKMSCGSYSSWLVFCFFVRSIFLYPSIYA